MQSRAITLAVALCFALPMSTSAQTRELEFAVLAQGNLSDDELHSQDQVIRDAATFAAVWSRIYPDGHLEPPQIDFQQRMVIFSTMDLQANLGDATIQVRQIELRRIRHRTQRFATVVHIEERRRFGCIVIPSASTPFVLVETALSWDVTYRRRTRYVDCG